MQRGFRTRWKISVKNSDEITRGHRIEFEIDKNFDDLIDTRVGLSFDDRKIIIAFRKRLLIEQQCLVCPLAQIVCG